MDNNFVLIPVPLAELIEAFKKVVRDEISAAVEMRTNKPVNEEPLTQKQLAKFLGVSDQSLIRWRKKKKIPVFFIGSAPRYNLNEVLAALNKNK